MPSGRLAFDIETVSPQLDDDQRPDFDNPEHFQMFALTCGYQAEPGAEVEREVFFRDGWGPEAELDVIERAFEWFEDYDAETTVTYNGEGFDFIHLNGRSRIASSRLGDRDDVHERARSFIRSIDSVDLQPESWDCFGKYTSFERTCENCEMDPPRTILQEYGYSADEFADHRRSKNALEPYVTGDDITTIGEWYLDAVESGETDSEEFGRLAAMIEHYAETDVVPLFDLADRRPFATYA